MFNFRIHQRVFEVGMVRIGGKSGENLTVMVGSIFYHGHKIVLDEKTGKVHREKAEELIKLQEEFSEKMGNPCILDGVGSTKEAMKSFVGIVADLTEAPLLVAPLSIEAKVEGLSYAKEIGLEKRVIYNSLTPESKAEEFEAIKENNVESAILLAYKSGFMKSKARINAIKELIPKAEKAGVTKPLLDTFLIDIPSLSMSCRAMLDLKGEFGLPCGCGAHNAISKWFRFNERMGAPTVKPCTANVNVAPVVLGGDLILYGPIEDCHYAFPSVYAADTLYKYL